MRREALLSAIALVVVVLVGAPTAFAGPNLLTNGSFEAGDFTGWTEGGNFEFTQVVSGPFYVYSGAEDGQFYATLGPVGSEGTLSQTFGDTAGAHYTFSFWLNAVGDDPSDFRASWDGNTLYYTQDTSSGLVWTLFSFSTTGTGIDTIQFSFRDDPGYIALDNVVVTQQSPEPSSLLLLVSGLVAVGGVVRSKLRDPARCIKNDRYR